MPLYELKNIIHRYKDRTALNIPDLQVRAHTVTGVVGPNGSGKSTLLSLLGFVNAPTAGEIRFNGRAAGPFSDVIRGQVALLPQESFLLKRSVFRNIAYGLQVAGQCADLVGRVHDAMAMVGLDPTSFSQRPWYALSGGEARRVALAARLVLKPQVLLMDEPTVSVDVASAQMIKEAAVHAWRQWGATLVISSHDAEWLADICDDVQHLFRGCVLGGGKHTMVSGPWMRRQNGLAVLPLADDQHLEALGAPELLDAAVAAVAADQLKIIGPSNHISADHRCLEGQLLRLSYEQSTHRTCAAVLVGRTVLTAYLGREPLAYDKLVPGRKIRLSYDPASIQWY